MIKAVAPKTLSVVAVPHVALVAVVIAVNNKVGQYYRRVFFRKCH